MDTPPRAEEDGPVPINKDDEWINDVIPVPFCDAVADDAFFGIFFVRATAAASAAVVAGTAVVAVAVVMVG